MPAALTIKEINTKKKSQIKSKNELDTNVIEERVFILKRLRMMLIAQREKFNNYLNLLVKEEEAILNEDTEKINRFMKLAIENGIVSDSFLFHNTAFRVSPPLIISPEQILEVCAKLASLLDRL